MTRKDLKDYKYNQMWIEDQKEYIEGQKETINRLSAILSDMPKGTKKVYDTEAEQLVELEDRFSELMIYIIEEERKQQKIVDEVKNMEYPYKNILFKTYIQGKSLVTVASEMNYNYEYTKKMNGIALNKFDERVG